MRSKSNKKITKRSAKRQDEKSRQIMTHLLPLAAKRPDIFTGLGLLVIALFQAPLDSGNRRKSGLYGE